MKPRASLLTLAASLLSAVACGPPGPGTGASAGTSETSGPDPDSSTTTDAQTESSSSSSGSESETTTAGPTTIFLPDSGEDGWLNEECDPFEQDCPDGEKCVPYASTGAGLDAHKCVPITGSQAAGEPCFYGGQVEAADDCDGDSACWNVVDVDGQGIGTCHAFCMGSVDAPSCPPGTECVVDSSEVITLCMSTCDPVLQDCTDGVGCYWWSDVFVCVYTDTQGNESGQLAGEPCAQLNDCESGLMCMTGEALPDCQSGACCTAYCDLMLGDAQCDAVPGTSCVAFFEQGLAPAGYEQVGVCVVP